VAVGEKEKLGVIVEEDKIEDDFDTTMTICML
jgi:hypothetical protein